MTKQNATINNIQIRRHSRVSLSGIYNACRYHKKGKTSLNKCVVDPRLQISEMTTLFNNGGFTLIEILVVVLIIGILAAIAVPQYQKAVEKARATEAVLTISTLEKAIDRWLLENGIPSDGYVMLGEGEYSGYTRANLDIDLPCIETEDNSCYLNLHSFQAYCTSDICSITSYPTGNKYYVLYSQRNFQTNIWERTCGYFDSVTKTVCDSLVPQGWKSRENYDV